MPAVLWFRPERAAVHALVAYLPPQLERLLSPKAVVARRTPSGLKMKSGVRAQVFARKSCPYGPVSLWVLDLSSEERGAAAVVALARAWYGVRRDSGIEENRKNQQGPVRHCSAEMRFGSACLDREISGM